jgi:multiple sugar transport system substrate-binding protein
MKKNILAIGLCFAILVFLAACGGSGGAGPGGNNADKADDKPKEPFTMIIHGGGVPTEEFDDRFRAVLEKKFPHITFKYYMNGKGTNVPDLIAAGEIPDILRPDIPTLLTNYLDLGLGVDLNPFVKKYKYDLSRFNKVFIDEIIEAGRTGELYGLPVPPYFPTVLYYNKNIFDKFGVPYPKDGISWDEVYALAQRTTRSEGGTNYRGFSFNPQSGLRDNVFSLPILDPSADRLADPDKWRLLFNNFKRMYDIPGNTIEKTISAENTAFNKGNVAMQLNQHNVYLNIPEEVNWDIVAYPTMEGAPKLMGQRGPAYWSLSKQSKHQDEAFQVIMEMLSDEVQMQDSLKGIPTTLNNKEIQAALGKGHPIFSKKNMNAVNYYPPAPYTPKRKPGLVDVPLATQQKLVGDTFIDIVMTKKDVNTALREMEEKLKQEIEKEKSK